MTDHYAVRCEDCEFTWHSAAMAEGLRVLGSCPKCKGSLQFSADAPAAAAAPVAASAAPAEPHMVLGIPRV